VRPRLVLGLLVTLNVVAHLPFLSGPPLGHHAWRQSDTAALARNYFEIDSNFFRPRIDWLGNESGITGTELPIYSWIVHLGYRAVGESLTLARSLTLACSCIALCALYGIARRWLGVAGGLLAVLFLLWSPAFFYYGRNVQPEVPMVAAMLGGLWCWYVWRERGTWRWLAAAIVLMATGAAIKPQGMMVAAPAFIDALGDLRQRRSPVLLVLAAGTLGPMLLWYRYARFITEAYGSFPYFGGFLYGLVRDPLAGPIAALTSPDFLWNVLLRDFRTDYLSYAGFTSLLAGVWFWRSLQTAVQLRLAAWIALGLAWLLLVSWMIEVHEYYALPMLPALAMVAGHGVASLLARTGVARAAAIVLILASPAMAIEMTARRVTGNLHPALVELGARLTGAIPRDTPVIIGPDESPVVALYHAHRRGWTFPYTVREPSFAEYVARGARYLVSADRGFERLPGVEPFLGEHVAVLGDVHVYALRRP
jgi:4-amino-4-deoxy-L-arabinose transferase-like glycosyltransferase